MRGRLPFCVALALVSGACAGDRASAPPSTVPKPSPPAAVGPPEPADAGSPAAAPAGLMSGALPGDRVPSFRATVRRAGGDAAREEPFDSLATRSATVYIVNSTQCPYCRDYVGRMRRIEDAYMPRGVDVVHVFPNRAEPAAEKVRWHAQQGFRGGQILDGDASIARLLEADKTPTVVLVDARGVIVYRGAIDDAPEGGRVGATYLADAIEAHLAGKPVAVSSTEPAG